VGEAPRHLQREGDRIGEVADARGEQLLYVGVKVVDAALEGLVELVPLRQDGLMHSPLSSAPAAPDLPAELVRLVPTPDRTCQAERAHEAGDAQAGVNCARRASHRVRFAISVAPLR